MKLAPQQLLGLGIWAISLGGGLVLSFLLVFVYFNTTLDHYGASYFLITVLSIAMMILIPLDYVFKTKIMPD